MVVFLFGDWIRLVFWLVGCWFVGGGEGTVLLIKTLLYLGLGVFSRGVPLGVGGMSIGGTVARLGRGDKCSFICVTKSLSAGGVISVSTRRLRRIVRRVLRKRGISCRVGSGGVVVQGGRMRRSVLGRGGLRSVSKLIVSIVKRPVMKIGIVRGKAAGNAVASVGNGFLLGTPTGTALVVDFVNCGALTIGLRKRGGIGVALGRSLRRLSRIIIINCKARGGSDLATSITAIPTGRLDGRVKRSITTTLRKETPKMRVLRGKKRTKTSVGVLIQKTNAFNTARPLCIVSNTFSGGKLGSLGPSSVRSVRVLGSNSTTTVCNSHTTGKIILVAAGRNRGNGTGIRVSTGCSLRAPSGCLSFLSTGRRHRCAGRVIRGSAGRARTPRGVRPAGPSVGAS